VHESIIFLIAHKITILLHSDFAKYDPPPSPCPPLLYPIHHTILVMARSWNGQAGRRRVPVGRNPSLEKHVALPVEKGGRGAGQFR